MAERPEALKIGVLNGPNLNLLGSREPEKYGRQTLEQINRGVTEYASQLGVDVTFFQSNIEGELVDWIQAARSNYDALLVNAAAYSHTSVAIRDALAAVGLPFVEVHLTNVYAREPFRHRSLISDVAVAVVAGFEADSYILALEGVVRYLRKQ